MLMRWNEGVDIGQGTRTESQGQTHSFTFLVTHNQATTQARPMGIKYYFTVLNYWVQAQRPTVQSFREAVRGYINEKRWKEVRRDRRRTISAVRRASALGRTVSSRAFWQKRGLPLLWQRYGKPSQVLTGLREDVYMATSSGPTTGPWGTPVEDGEELKTDLANWPCQRGWREGCSGCVVWAVWLCFHRAVSLNSDLLNKLASIP